MLIRLCHFLVGRILRYIWW